MQEPVNDLISQLSERDLAELSALADGTLPAERRQAVEARVEASPELRALVERQRRAVAASRMLADEPVPPSLHEAVAGARRERSARRSRRRRFAPGLALAGALAAVAVVVGIVLTGGPAGPSVADAADLATQPPSGPAPPPVREDGTALAAKVDGVEFPNLAQAFGWQAVGVRRGRVDGRDATVVYYRRGGRQIAYVIVAGEGLPRPSDARESVRSGVRFQTLRLNGRLAVTWRRDGNTCILVGKASPAELLALASWQGAAAIRY
jgi:anti-sigma factor RsiW